MARASGVLAAVFPLAGLLCLLAGCPLGHPGADPVKCFSNEDCFEREGEYCKRPQNAPITGAAGQCLTKLDGAVPLPADLLHRDRPTAFDHAVDQRPASDLGRDASPDAPAGDGGLDASGEAGAPDAGSAR